MRCCLISAWQHKPPCSVTAQAVAAQGLQSLCEQFVHVASWRHTLPPLPKVHLPLPPGFPTSTAEWLQGHPVLCVPADLSNNSGPTVQFIALSSLITGTDFTSIAPLSWSAWH
jgi:hypothetical protein